MLTASASSLPCLDVVTAASASCLLPRPHPCLALMLSQLPRPLLLPGVYCLEHVALPASLVVSTSINIYVHWTVCVCVLQRDVDEWLEVHS